MPFVLYKEPVRGTAESFPALRFCKQGKCSLNKAALVAMGIASGGKYNVYVDRETGRVGLRSEETGAAKLGSSHSHKSGLLRQAVVDTFGLKLTDVRLPGAVEDPYLVFDFSPYREKKAIAAPDEIQEVRFVARPTEPEAIEETEPEPLPESREEVGAAEAVSDLPEGFTPAKAAKILSLFDSGVKPPAITAYVVPIKTAEVREFLRSQGRDVPDPKPTGFQGKRGPNIVLPPKPAAAEPEPTAAQAWEPSPDPVPAIPAEPPVDPKRIRAMMGLIAAPSYRTPAVCFRFVAMRVAGCDYRRIQIDLDIPDAVYARLNLDLKRTIGEIAKFTRKESKDCALEILRDHWRVSPDVLPKGLDSFEAGVLN